jgi:D-hexose-6-phosphate mutarotase
MDIGALNALFAISGHLHFEAGEGGLTKAVINNPYASSEIYFQGATITSFKPHDTDELLWLSDEAVFDSEYAIRGGVPVCWPWFGKQEGKVQHGFARKMPWTLFGTTVNGRGETVIRLGLQDNEATRKEWPCAFTLQYEITVGPSLTMELTTVNEGDEPFDLSQALHTYFAVDNIDNVRVEGLDGKHYADALDGFAEKTQNGDICFNSEVDRVYEDNGSSCLLHDGSHTLEVVKSGSGTTVVWNPWIEKSERMNDFNDTGYKTMVCIETANALADTRTLEAGERHVLMQQIRSAGRTESV